MTIESLKGVVADGGGYDQIALLIFDNAIHVSFTKVKAKDKCKESDFIQLGDEWFYKEPSVFRSKLGEYDVNLFTYHPLDCLQAVIMGDVTNLDTYSQSDML